jgi:hypothetical protein
MNDVQLDGLTTPINAHVGVTVPIDRFKTSDFHLVSETE